MKKRLLACLLILSLFVTGLGFVPAVQAAEDGISAQWTTKENLAPADQEVMLRPEKGDLSEDSASEITGESNQYQDSDMVTVIVELEDAPLAEAAPTDVKSFAASTQGVALERELRSTQDAIKAEIRSWSGAVSTQSVNGASDLEYSYTTVLNGFSMKMPYGDIARARELETVPAAFTFDRPPKEVVTGRPVGLINTPDDRRDLMQRLYGIRQVIIAPFDRAMMTMPWQDFIDDLLIGTYGAVHLVAGHDYHFGHRNQGDPDKLLSRCRERGIGCDIIPQVTLDGITVSSTYIRTLVESGQMERAADFLGHRHCLTRTVTHGCRFGRTIGIPTVNLTPPDHVLLPERGVYVTRVFLPDGTSVPGVTNIGTRPTVSDGDAVSVETFLLDFDGDLYDKTIRVEFCRRLRPERRFASPQELKAEIQHNIQQTRDYFIENPE